ncbi:MAG TPA: flagellar protein FlgN [Nitrospirota bacterium]|nr:flagellar protein FlgN [Nitrospirota bacterium]
MDDKYSDLLEILEKEVGLFRDFLTLLQKERQYMIDLSLDKLHECHNQKETIIFNLKVLEDARVELITELQGDNGTAFTTTLSIIIDHAPLRYKKGLESCQSNLKSLVDSIREINQINGILADRAINYTRNSLSFLNSLICQLPVYHQSGRIAQESMVGTLVCKKG